jgi:hypothetical protein
MKKIDFEADLKNEILIISKKMGFKIVENQDLNKMLLDYLTVRTKIIEQKHRNVFVNPDFLIELKNHPKKKEIETIIKYAADGKGLNVFQSRRVFQTNFHDHLQQEWNIYHFHLSLMRDHKSIFVKQVNSLLFAYIDKFNIVFLGSETHKNGIFGDVKWIEVLHDHFPQLINVYRDNTITDLYPNLNSIDRQTVWNKGLTVGMTKIKGVVYHNPGIGQMTSGHSFKISKTANEILRWIYKLDEQIGNITPVNCEQIGILYEHAEFKIIMDKTLELIEKSTGLHLLEFPEVFEEE